MSGRRVLILSWRDVRSPRSGEAELLTHELAKHLVTRCGDHLTWFTSRPRGASRTWRHSADLSWERTGEAFANVVDDVIGRGGD